MNEIRFYDSWEDSVDERCKPLSSLIHGGHVSASVLPERLTPHFKKHTKKWGWKTGFWCHPGDPGPEAVRQLLEAKAMQANIRCGKPSLQLELSFCKWKPQRDSQKLEAWIERCSLFSLSGPEDWAARDPHFVCYFPMFSGPCRHFLAQCRTETLLDPNPFLLPREPKRLWFWKIWYVWTHKKGDWPSRIESICVPLICLPCTIVASHTTPGQKWLAAATISP